MISLKILQICNHVQRNYAFFTRSLHRSSTALCFTKEITTNNPTAPSRPEPSDELIQNIRSALDTGDLLDLISNIDKKSPQVTSKAVVIESLQTLFSLQKSGHSSLASSQILRHPQFEQLCRNLRTVSRSLDLNETLQVLKFLSYIGVASKSEIIYIIFELVRRQINDLTLGHIVFLNFLLQKMDKIPMAEAIQLALPMIFQMQLKTQMDHENVQQLTDLLYFASQNRISDQCIMSIVTALTLHGDSLKPEQAKIIIFSLCGFNYSTAINFEKLLKNCFSVLNQNFKLLNFGDYDSLLSKLTDRMIRDKSSVGLFYNENFFNKCATSAVENDIGLRNAFYILKKFVKINFINLKFLDYLAEKIIENPTIFLKFRINSYITFVTGLSIANYKPEKQWPILKAILLEHPMTYLEKIELPWFKLNIELMSLDLHRHSMLEKVFSNEFLEKHLAREQNFLDYLQLLSLYQSVNLLLRDHEYNGSMPNQKFIHKAIELSTSGMPALTLKSILETIFGGPEFIRIGMKSKFGHFIDYVLVFDRMGNIMKRTDGESNSWTFLEDLQSMGDVKIVCIIYQKKSHYTLNIPRLKGCFDLRNRTLEALNVSVVSINPAQWNDMPAAEKLPFLETEIRYKIKE